MTTETVYGQTLALWLENGDEHCVLESDMTGQLSRGTFTFILPSRALFRVFRGDMTKLLHVLCHFKTKETTVMLST